MAVAIALGRFYAAGGGLGGLKRTLACNIAASIYGAATIAVVAWVDGTVALGLDVGAFILATLHEFVPLLSFTPGGFFGYASCLAATLPRRPHLALRDSPAKPWPPSCRCCWVRLLDWAPSNSTSG